MRGEDSIDVVCSEAGLVKMLFEEESHTVLVLSMCRDEADIDNANALRRGGISGVANVGGDGSCSTECGHQGVGGGAMYSSIKTERWSGRGSASSWSGRGDQRGNVGAISCKKVTNAMDEFFGRGAIIFKGAETLGDGGKDIMGRYGAWRWFGNGRDKRGMEVVEVVVVPRWMGRDLGGVPAKL